MYRRNVAADIGFCPILVTTGLVTNNVAITVYRVIDNGTQSVATGSSTYKGNGQYNFHASSDDMNGSHISFMFTATGTFPIEKTIITTAGNPDDGAAFGLTDIAGGLVTAGAVSDVVILNLTTDSRLTDSTGIPLTTLTLSQVLGTLLINTIGDRAGLGTRFVEASLNGASGYTFSAARVSQTEIQMTVKIPTGL